MNDPVPHRGHPAPGPLDRLRLDGRAFIVTGAGGGIGEGIVASLLAAGASVLGQTRTSTVAAPGSNDRLVTKRCELTDADAPAELVATAIASFGRIDGLVNNAGLQTLAPFVELADDQWAEMIAVNLTAAHRLTQAVANQIIAEQSNIGEPSLARPKGGRIASHQNSGDRTGAQTGGDQAVWAGGSIVHIASIEARHPTVLHGHYATSKAGLVMHAKAAALAYGPHGIRVNAVLPGLVDRGGLGKDWPEGVARWTSAAPLGRLGTPTDIGDACAFLCSDMASFITGAELVVDGGVLTNPTW